MLLLYSFIFFNVISFAIKVIMLSVYHIISLNAILLGGERIFLLVAGTVSKKARGSIYVYCDKLTRGAASVWQNA